MRKSIEHAGDVTRQIINNVDFEKYQDIQQRYVQIHPIIANAMYDRDNELIEKVRMQTLITLARSIKDDEVLNHVIDSLKYKLIIKT